MEEARDAQAQDVRSRDAHVDRGQSGRSYGACDRLHRSVRRRVACIGDAGVCVHADDALVESGSVSFDATLESVTVTVTPAE